jgi:heptosyltransferase-1
LSKILIVKPSSLGDVVHALRVVRQIKLKVPDCEIHWVIKDGLEGILDSVQWIDRYFIFKRGKGLISYLRLILEIRKCEYDYCLDLQGLLRSSLIVRFARSKLKLGRADGREFSTLFYRSVGCDSRKSEMHAIDRLTPFLGKLGISEYDLNLPLDIGNCPLGRTKRKSIILFPESRRTEKIWPYFQELADWLNNTHDWDVYVAGNNKDDSFADCIDLRGNLTLAQLINFIRKSSIVVCNDSAPLHIASAIGTKVIALFGPTEPSKYGPYPSNENGNFTICSKSKKMADIDTNELKNALTKAINSINEA